MPETPGTSELTPDQQQWFVERYGLRYLRVQDNAAVPNRKTRRQLEKNARKAKR